MTTLSMIRHAQASFGAENYDVLSPLGVVQSRLLGSWLARNLTKPVLIWSGPLQRQVDTAKYMLEGAFSEGCRLPEPQIIDGFRELPGAELVRHIIPQLDQNPLDDDVKASDNRSLRAIEIALDAWANNKAALNGLESFSDFENRVTSAINGIVAQSLPDQQNIVVTSAGPLVIAARAAFAMAPGPTIKLGSVLANSGVTDFVWHDKRLTLQSFNATHHLGSEEITYM
jgi:broad specificity phosphatase PhoE